MKKTYLLSQIKKILLGISPLFFLGSYAQTTTFTYTGALQTYTVPVGVTSIQIETWGAQGQGGNGGLGGYAKGTMTVSPGQVLNIYVGGMAGYNGGGLGHAAVPRNGGGASDVRVSPYALANRVIVAGGGGAGGPTDVGIRNGGTGGGGTVGPNYVGGGGGDGYGGNGGAGGSTGGAGNTSCHSGGGGGGGYTSGGGGSCNTCYGGTCGQAGTLGQGGNADTWENGICYNTYGGTNGGGGGYYGGGGSSVGNCGGGGGGGGSSYVGTLTNTVMTAGIRSGDGQIIITVLNIYSATITQSTQILCNGQSTATLNVTVSGGTGPYTYSWSPSGGTGATASGLSAGTYTVTVTDATSSVTTQTFTVTQPTAISVTSTQTNVLCNGNATGSAHVTATGGTPAYTYSWSPSGGTGATASGLTAGSYTCTVTDANGCTTTQPVTLTQPSGLVATANAGNILCNGGTTTVNVLAAGGTAPYSGTGSFTQTAGTYTYTVTDANGCTASYSLTISQPPVLAATVVSSTNPTTCNGTNGAVDVTVTGGTPGYTYAWSNAATTQDLSGVPAGSYTNTITDMNGCTTIVSTTLTDPNPPTVTLAIPVDTLCLASGSYTLSGGSPAGGTFSGPGVSSGAFSPSTAGAGLSTITYSYTDPNTLCSGISTDNIFVDPCLVIANLSLENNFTILPNPNNGTFTVQINATEISDVLIYNSLGQLVSKQKVQPNIQTPLNISDSGVYLITVVTADGKRSSQQVVVRK